MTLTLKRADAARLALLTALAVLAAIVAGAILDTAAGPLVGGLSFGAVTLAEAAKLSRDDLQRGVVQTFRINSPILERIPLLEIDGNAYAYNEEAALPGVEFRAVNASYSESTGTVNQKTEKLVILGGEADVDKFIQRTRSNLNDQRAVQTGMKVKAASYKYQDTFINGDTAVDANAFDGLKKRLTGAQVIDAATNGLAILGASDADRHAFFDKLDELLAAVPGGADVLLMNSLLLGKIKASARRLTIYDQTRDDFGRSISLYNGVPLLDVGTKADGTLIIPQTETQGSSNVASSIYAVKFGQDEADRAVTGLTNGGVQVDDLGELESKPAFRTRIEFYTGLAIFGPGAARLRGVLNG